MDAEGPKFSDRQATPAPATPVSRDRVYLLDVAGVRALDRAAEQELGIPGLVLMENAARSLLPHAMRLTEHQPPSTLHAACICGPGNNGGDGLTLARHLHNAGFGVSVVLIAPREQYKGDAGVHLETAHRLAEHAPVADGSLLGGFSLLAAERAHTLPTPNLVVDAMFGTGLSRPLSGPALAMCSQIDTWHQAGARVLSVDTPSGLDAQTGGVLGAGCVQADCTVTLAALKPGLVQLDAQQWVGELVVGGIGVPEWLVARFGRPWVPASGRMGDAD